MLLRPELVLILCLELVLLIWIISPFLGNFAIEEQIFFELFYTSETVNYDNQFKHEPVLW